MARLCPLMAREWKCRTSITMVVRGVDFWYGGFGGDAAHGLHNLELTGRGLPHETVAGEQARGFAVTLPVSTPTC
jgi:hypothetical protein